MFEYLVCVVLILLSFYWLPKYYLENGYYFPVSRRYGARRYVFPKGDVTIKKLTSECRHVCRKVISNGEVLNYPFLEKDVTSRAFTKRVIMIFYERSDAEQTPVAFNAAFVFTWKKQRCFHCGLMMVVPEHQKQGIQTLSVWSAVFQVLFRGVEILTDITGYAGGASFLTIQDRTQCDAYPVWRHPEVHPKQWQLELVRFMLAHYRSEFGCSRLATLDEDTLVVINSNAKEGGGCWQLLETFDMHNQRSSSLAKQEFINKRLNYKTDSEQFFVGRPDFRKWLSSKFGFTS